MVPMVRKAGHNSELYVGAYGLVEQGSTDGSLSYLTVTSRRKSSGSAEMRLSFRLRTSLRLAAFGAALAGTLAPTIRAQTVRGRITAKANAEPVAGGIVALIDSTGRAVVTTLADDRGVFLFSAPAPGRYSLRVERVGFHSTTAAPFALGVGDTVDLPVAIAGAGQSLRAVKVTADRRCVVRPQEGLAAAQLWDEARKALSATQLTQMAQAASRVRRDPHRFVVRVRRFVRILHPQSLSQLRSDEVESEGESVTPFASVDPTLLARDGYIMPEPDGGATYFAPDATVLLSDLFLDSHCFRVQAPASGQREDFIGLAFEPLERFVATTRRGDPRVDVQGVLWLDRATAELRYMEYRYTNLRLGVPTHHLGGQLEFRPLPDGRWIVWRWFIRLPQLERRRAGADPLVATLGNDQITLGSIKEEGGEVLEVMPAGTRRNVFGSVAGVVLDSLRGAPMAGARVFFSGTSHAAITDSLGRYRIDSVPPGMYAASLLATRLDTLLLDSPVERVTLSAGVEARVDFGLPAFGTLVAQLCPGMTKVDSLAVVIGLVRDTSGALASGASVTAGWQRFSTVLTNTESERLAVQALSAQTASSSVGRFALCGIPPDQRVMLRATLGRATAEVRGLHLAPREIRRLDLSLKLR